MATISIFEKNRASAIQSRYGRHFTPGFRLINSDVSIKEFVSICQAR